MAEGIGLDPEFKKEWVATLRSGKYIQGKERLINIKDAYGEEKVSYCCLGVACKVARIEDNNFRAFIYITDEVVKFSELIKPLVGDEGVVLQLMKMNDGVADENGIRQDQKSFAEIADFIEEYL